MNESKRAEVDRDAATLSEEPGIGRLAYAKSTAECTSRDTSGETPRTDEFERLNPLVANSSAMGFARQLERELAALGKDYERLLKESTEELKAARSSTAAHSVPDGWQMVPSEPTDDMLEAMNESHGDGGGFDALYKAALAYSPPAPIAHSATGGKSE